MKSKFLYPIFNNNFNFLQVKRQTLSLTRYKILYPKAISGRVALFPVGRKPCYFKVLAGLKRSCGNWQASCMFRKTKDNYSFLLTRKATLRVAFLV